MKIRSGFVSNSSTTSFSYSPRWPRQPRKPRSPASPVVKNVVDSESPRKIEILESLLDIMPAGAEKAHVYMVHDKYLDGEKPSDDELKKTRNILYKNRLREEADHFRMASQGMDIMGKKDKSKPVAPPKKDPNKIVVGPSKERNPVEYSRIQERAKGTGGAGAHKNREKDVERGKAPEKHKKDPRDKEAQSYSGNPDGKPIYPNEIQHGYGEPLAGGTDVMRRLQNNLLHEQGNTDQMRPTSPRVAGAEYEACVKFLDENMVRLGKKDSAWWLPAHNFGINMTMLGKLNLWVFSVLPLFAQKKAYLPAGEDPKLEPAGIVTHAIWTPHPHYRNDDFPATLKTAEVLLKAAKQHSMVGETVEREMAWIENEFHIDIPTMIKTRWSQEAPKLAARRWSVDRLRVKDKFIPLDGQPAQDMSSWGRPQYRTASASRVASLYLRKGEF